MILYSMLLSSSRLTPEEGILLTPFLKNSIKPRMQKKINVKFLPEVKEQDSQNMCKKIFRFRVSKKTNILYQLI
jgi:hypothetical protein